MESISTPVKPPSPVEHLYRLRDRASTLLYVGITNNWPARMKQHQGDKPWWHEVAAVELVGVFGTRAQLEAIERAVIKTEEPVYNVRHNRRPVSLPPSAFSIGDRVQIIGRPSTGPGTIVATTPGGGCWLVCFDLYGHSDERRWTLCSNEIELVADSRRFHDYGEESLSPDDRQQTVEDSSEYAAEWHYYATRPLGEGWVVEHPQFGEGLILDVQPMALDSTVTIKFYDDDVVRKLCAEWVPLKVVAK